MLGPREDRAQGKDALGQRDARDSSREYPGGYKTGMYQGLLCYESTTEH